MEEMTSVKERLGRSAVESCKGYAKGMRSSSIIELCEENPECVDSSQTRRRTNGLLHSVNLELTSMRLPYWVYMVRAVQTSRRDRDAAREGQENNTRTKPASIMADRSSSTAGPAAEAAENSPAAAPMPNPTPESYSLTQYRKDAALICHVKDLANTAAFRELAQAIDRDTEMIARGALKSGLRPS